MSEFTGDPEIAESDLRRASDAVARADDVRAEAVARADAIENEPFDGTPEAEADISARMAVAQGEIEVAQQLFSEAEDKLGRTQENWTERGYLQ